jgi:uncharacterized protein
MTPQERQLIDELFDRLAKLESAPRDGEAAAAIAEGLRAAPNAVYPLVQTALVQDEALKRANARIQDLEQALSAGSGQGSGQAQSGGFLDTMRDKLFGQQSQQRGSVPNVPLPPSENRAVWNSGQVMGQMPPGRYDQGPYGQGYGQSYGQGYGQGPYGAPQSPFGGGGSFLGTAAAAAAGAVGGSLLLNSIRGMMGGSHAGFGDPTTVINEKVINESPSGSDQSRSDLARDAGVNDIDSADRRFDDNSRDGFTDTASNDDRDDMDLDSDDFGNDNDGGSDYI